MSTSTSRSCRRLKLHQAASIFTDAGGAGIPGVVSFISSKAEFTPRNVQTAEDSVEARLPRQGHSQQRQRHA